MILKRINQIIRFVGLLYCFSIFSMELENEIVINNYSKYELDVNFQDWAYLSPHQRLFGGAGKMVTSKVLPGERQVLKNSQNELLTSQELAKGIEIIASSYIASGKTTVKKEDLNNFAAKNRNQPIEIIVSVQGSWVPTTLNVSTKLSLPQELGWEEISSEEPGFVEVPEEEEVPKKEQEEKLVEDWQKIQEYYTSIFEDVPEKYHKIIAPKLMEESKKTAWQRTTNLEDLINDVVKAKKFAYELVLENLNIPLAVPIYYLSGYLFILPERAQGELFQAKCNEIEKANRGKDITKLEKIAGAYKIHLMPKSEDLFETAIILAKEINENQELGAAVQAFKVLGPRTLQESAILPELEEHERFARIVIYPANGKENAQKVLDIIIKLFGQKEGRDFTPRYNQRVSSFIFFAQGDGDCKSDSDLQKYFEQPNMIYYKPDFTGKWVDYHLKF